MQAPGVLMLDLEGLSLTPEESELLQRPEVGGVILFSRNYVEPSQLRDLVAALREIAAHLLIAVDQEGGRVQRFRQGFLELPSLRSIGEVHEQEPRRALQLAQQCGWAMASEILLYGIDFSFAPVLDVYSSSSPVIGRRSFAADANTVIALAHGYIQGMHEAGMAATGKHFPGHGMVNADSHDELPVDERSWEELLDQDLRCFSGCFDVLDAIMPAHVLYPAVDKVAAGFSRTWIEEKLQGELGFKGVVFSDDLSMNAAHSAGDVQSRVDQALQAGCDMVLVCNDRPGALQAADWLQQNRVAANARLATMRSRAGADIAGLYSTARWQAARDAVATLKA